MKDKIKTTLIAGLACDVPISLLVDLLDEVYQDEIQKLRAELRLAQDIIGDLQAELERRTSERNYHIRIADSLADRLSKELNGVVLKPSLID